MVYYHRQHDQGKAGAGVCCASLWNGSVISWIGRSGRVGLCHMYTECVLVAAFVQVFPCRPKTCSFQSLLGPSLTCSQSSTLCEGTASSPPKTQIFTGASPNLAGLPALRLHQSSAPTHLSLHAGTRSPKPPRTSPPSPWRRWKPRPCGLTCARRPAPWRCW